MRRLVPALLLLACSTPDANLPFLGETGWLSDTDPCAEAVEVVEPAQGEVGWSPRDDLSLRVVGQANDASLRLRAVGGSVVPTTLQVGEGEAWLRLDEPMQPGTEHVLEIEDCAGARAWSFTTDSLGLPVEGGVDALTGATFRVDLAGATWDAPQGVGQLLAAAIQDVLVGVRAADPLVIDLVGGFGIVEDGQVFQADLPTFDFPPAPFADAPWFLTTAARFDLVVPGGVVPVGDFTLSGAFSPDGARISGARISGLADTRSAGGVVGRPGVATAVCDAAAGLDVACEPCADGEPTCLRIALRRLDAHRVPGLRLDDVLP